MQGTRGNSKISDNYHLLRALFPLKYEVSFCQFLFPHTTYYKNILQATHTSLISVMHIFFSHFLTSVKSGSILQLIVHHHLIGWVFSFLMVYEIMMTHINSRALDLMKYCIPQYLSSYSQTHSALSNQVSCCAEHPCPSLLPELDPRPSSHLEHLSSSSHTQIQSTLQRPTKDIS